MTTQVLHSTALNSYQVQLTNRRYIKFKYFATIKLHKFSVTFACQVYFPSLSPSYKVSSRGLPQEKFSSALSESLPGPLPLSPRKTIHKNVRPNCFNSIIFGILHQLLVDKKLWKSDRPAPRFTRSPYSVLAIRCIKNRIRLHCCRFLTQNNPMLNKLMKIPYSLECHVKLSIWTTFNTNSPSILCLNFNSLL